MANQQHLREQMHRCRRLAGTINDDRARSELLSMAAEFELQIDRPANSLRMVRSAHPGKATGTSSSPAL